MKARRLRAIPAEAPPTLRPLGVHGQALWASLNGDYEITDPARLMMLQECCEATDRVQDCAATIAKDGCVIRGKDGAVKDHPALRAELQNRAFVVRTLARLLADADKAKRGPGRPAVGFGWIPPDAR